MNQLLGLQVECRHSKRGCPWSGDLRALRQHVEETCRKALAICPHCSFECAHQAFPEHVPVCAEAPQPCPNRCSATGVKRKHMKHHLEQECVLRVVGSDIVPHAANQCIQVAPLAVTVTSYSQYVSTGNTWYSPPFYTHKNGYKVHLKVNTNWYKRGYVSVHVCVLKGEYDSTLTWPLYAEVKVALYNWRTNKPLFSKVLHLPGDAFCSMNTTNLPASWGRGYLQFISHASLASDLANNVEYIQHDSLNFQIEEVTIVKAPAMPRLPSWAGDGCFAVPSFHSIKEKDLHFYVSPIYTHEDGYKLCMRVRPNGCGVGKGTHVSVCCFLMCGEHDDALPWPVEADVVLEMLNWRENKNHERDTVTLSHGAGAEVSSRVTVDSRAEYGTGTDTFATHSSLSYNATANTQYLNEDCLLFKVVSCTAYLDRASASKVPRWQPPNTPACFTITDVAKRRESSNLYYSPPFVAAKYKMYFRVYCGGYGAGKGTHVSMYACLLKGEDDDSLEWPFCGDITVEVLNWHGDHDHYKNVLSLDSPDDDTHARVMTEVTLQAGCGKPQFMPLSTLSSKYLEDECMRIRVSSVVCYNTPALVLMSKTPRWQNTSSRWPLAFTVTGFSSRLENGSRCYSPPFYTHSRGYKMRLVVRPGASGKHKGNMSVRAQLMAGEYDSSLQWPMNVDLTVEMVNWARNSSHVTETIPFGTAPMDCRTRVPKESKVATSVHGYGDFCSHATLFGGTRDIVYVEDDCVHIRVNKAVVHSR